MTTSQNSQDLINAAIENGNARILTVELANQLIGKRIITKYFGYRGQDGYDDFVIGEIISEYELASRNVDLNTFPQGNQAKYWESYMSDAELKRHKNKLHIITNKGFQTHIKVELDSYNPTDFWCSDSDRYVHFIEVPVQS